MEAQAAARLSHPNIVNVYDVVDEGTLHYIVMELIEGITLKSYILKRAVSTARKPSGLLSRWHRELQLPMNRVSFTGISSRRILLLHGMEK